MLAALLLSTWQYYAIPVAAESVASEIALSKPWNREANPVPLDKPVQYVFRIGGAAGFAAIDTKLENSHKDKLKWCWRGLYILGNSVLVYNSIRHMKKPEGWQ